MRGKSVKKQQNTADRTVWCDMGWQPVFIGFVPSAKAWEREICRLRAYGVPYPDSDGRCTIFDAPDGKTVCLVTLNERAAEGRSLEPIIGLIVHEAAHVWQAIQKVIGETSPGAEMEAYALQAIVQGLIDAYQKTRGLPS